MALPPIIANNPIMKLFRAEQPKQKSDAASVPEGLLQDTVEISDAARKKFGEVQLLADRQARGVAEKTRDILSQDETQTLGLDPKFAD